MIWAGTKIDEWNHSIEWERRYLWKPYKLIEPEPDNSIERWLKENPVKNIINLGGRDAGMLVNNVCKIDYNPMRDEYVVSYISGSGISIDVRELNTKLEACLNRLTVSDIFINGKKSEWKDLHKILDLGNACNLIRNFHVELKGSEGTSFCVSLEIDSSMTCGFKPRYDYSAASCENAKNEARKEKGKMGNQNYYGKNYSIRKYFEIKNIIFNEPATIVMWGDGTKTVVKCQDGDTFDPEKGIAMAIMKRALGSNETGSNYLKPVKKYLDKYYKDTEEFNTLALETLKTILHGALHGSFKSDGEVETEERNENTDTP